VASDVAAGCAIWVSLVVVEICTCVTAPWLAVTAMVPLLVELIFPVTVLKRACGGQVAVALVDADVLALAIPHPARSTLATMRQNTAATAEIRRLGARMHNSSGPLAD
jgi:hypothetical protein